MSRYTLRLHRLDRPPVDEPLDAADVEEARERAYAAVRRIDWPGGFHRGDIGWRAMGRAGE